MGNDTETETGFFGDLWDTARGVFKDYIDFESFKFEKKLTEDRWAWEASNNQKQAPVASNYASPGSSMMPWVIGAVAVGAAVLLFKPK